MDTPLLDVVLALPPHEIEPAILDVLQHHRITPHLRVLKHASVQHALLSNYSRSLRIAASSERTSGFFRGSLSSMLHASIDKAAVASLLNVSPSSVSRALSISNERYHNGLMTGIHNKFASPTKYKVSRLPVATSIVTDWIISHCHPSANSANVVRNRNADGTWSYEIMHYRNESIAELFTKYKAGTKNA